MKRTTSWLTYLSALVIGILLLCFREGQGLFEGIIIAIGILITVPSAILLITCFVGKKDAEGIRRPKAWYNPLTACAGLVLGIWMLCMPTFFVSVTVYTLGAVLIFVGVSGIVFISNASRPARPLLSWFIVPVLTVTGGLLICFIGPKTLNTWATVVTGILLIVYAVNGFASLGREARAAKALASEEAELTKDITAEAVPVAEGQEPSEESPGNAEHHTS